GLVFPHWLQAQINILPGGSVLQNFDSLGITSGTTAANLPAKWRTSMNGTVRNAGDFNTAGTKTTQSGNNISSGGIYNFGDPTNASSDRAIGGLSSGSAGNSVN